MTWTYDTNLLTSRDQIRFLTGLTDTNNQRVSDEEIAGALSLANDDVYEAAAIIADSLAGKYSSTQRLKIDEFEVDFTKQAEYFRDLASKLRKLGSSSSGGFGVPFVSGISKSEVDSVNADTDRIPSRFRVGMHDDTRDVIDERDESSD